MEFRTQADLWTLMFTCWRLEAKWWRLSVVFFVCYSSINTVLINNVTGAQCAWLSWGLIPNCQYCTDEALSMCMLGFLALWASLCMSVLPQPLKSLSKNRFYPQSPLCTALQIHKIHMHTHTPNNLEIVHLPCSCLSQLFSVVCHRH